MNTLPSELEPQLKKLKEDDDDEDDIDPDKALEKSAAELQKEFNEAEFIEGSNDTDDRDTQGKLIPKKEKHPFYYNRLARHYIMNDIKKENRNATLTSATYHKKTKLLITAYSTGAFYLHEMPDMSMIHSLSISEFAIETACFNNTGDWIALGAVGIGQLLVWEWQSILIRLLFSSIYERYFFVF